MFDSAGMPSVGIAGGIKTGATKYLAINTFTVVFLGPVLVFTICGGY